MMKNLLGYRFVLFNGLAFALLAYLAREGIVELVLSNDKTGLVLAISILFGCGWLWLASRVFRLSGATNRQKVSPTSAHPEEKEKALTKIAWLGDISGWLVGLGLLGTVIGFSVALSGVDQNSLSQASGVQESIGTLMSGMRIAINTTIAGAVASIWHEVNYRMLKTATEAYWSDRIMAGAS